MWRGIHVMSQRALVFLQSYRHNITIKCVGSETTLLDVVCKHVEGPAKQFWQDAKTDR